MTPSDLARAAQAATEAADALQDELARVWLRTLRKMTRQIAKGLVRHGTLVAAGQLPGWRMPRRSEIQASIDEQLAAKQTNAIRVKVGEVYVGGLAAHMAVNFDQAAPLIDKVISKQAGGLITQVTESWIRDSMASLQDSYDKGLSIPNAARAMTKQMNGLAVSRATTISRTELAGVTNGSTLAVAKLVGAGRNKVWIATGDARTRDSHAEMDGETVPIDAEFSNGCDHPGDPNGDAEEVINCRCTLDFTDDSMLASGATMTTTPNAGGTMATPAVADQEQETAPAADGGIAWTSVFAVEGVDTSDERRLAPDSTSWRDLPLTLMAQSVTDIGHDGAQVAGRIDNIWRDGNQIMASGVFSSDEYGQQIAAWVGDGTLRGVSIDLAADEWEIEPYPAEETDPADADLIDLFGPPGIMVVTKGTILGATITPFPAFAEATIMLASAAPDVDGKRRRVLRVNSSIALADTAPPAAASDPPAADSTVTSDPAAIVADLTEVAGDYAGTTGQIVVTIDGEDTTIPFPPAGTADPDASEDATTASALSAAVDALELATKALRKVTT